MNEIQRVFSDAKSWCKVPRNRSRLVWAAVLAALVVAILPEVFQGLDEFGKYFLLLIPVAMCVALVRRMTR